MSEMGRPAGLVKRKGSGAWYYRRRYPADVAGRIGRAEFMQSLGTGILAEAVKRRSAAEAAYLQSLSFVDQSTGINPTAVRPARNLDPGLPELTTDAATILAVQHFERRLRELEAEGVTSARSPEWQMEVEEVESELSVLADTEDPNCSRWIEAEEIELLREHGLRADGSDAASKLLRQYLRRSMLQIARVRHAHLHGDFSDQVTDQLFRAGYSGAALTPAVRSRRAATVEELVALFEDEHLSTGEVSAKTVHKIKAALALITRHFGPTTPVTSVDRDACFQFRDTLAKLPPNFTKRHGKGTALKRIADANAKAGGPGLNRQTQEHYLRTLRRVLDLAKDRRFVSENVAAGIKPKGKAVRKEAVRNSYSKAQLETIFTAPLYTGCTDDERGFATPGPNWPRRSRFWVPLIALFTGLRLEEILQLTANHVLSDENGDPYLFISPDMQVKTVNGYRQVPVHQELLRIGFTALVEKARNRPSKLLFDDVPAASDSYRSTVFSKRYATFIRSLKLDEPGRKVTFHSFRHSFRDQLRRPHANPDLVRELGGWSRGSDTSTAYGDGTPAHVLRELVDSIDYGIDFSHLYTPA